jgi:hypothetical protein
MVTIKSTTTFPHLVVMLTKLLIHALLLRLSMAKRNANFIKETLNAWMSAKARNSSKKRKPTESFRLYFIKINSTITIVHNASFNVIIQNTE